MRPLATALFAILSMVVTSVSFSAEMPLGQPPGRRDARWREAVRRGDSQ
jgi:hypothetical protein